MAPSLKAVERQTRAMHIAADGIGRYLIDGIRFDSDQTISGAARALARR